VINPFIGEIQIFGFGFAPADWALCDGTLVAIKAYPGLFSLIGTTYGGDGVDKFRLPNLSGRAICGHGTGTGLTPRRLNDSFGVNSVSLSAAQVPDHSHNVNVYAVPPGFDKVVAPKAGYVLSTPEQAELYFKSDTEVAKPVTMATTVRASEGGDQPHENRQPFVALNFYIALRGEMPAF
jgi:microcystin-dependent protein